MTTQNPRPDAHALAARIDHTILKPEATADAVDQIISEAITHRFASVCVNGRWVARAASLIRQARTANPDATPADQPPRPLVCAVAGFPLGASKPTITAIEAAAAAKDGAEEIDIVAHLPHLLTNDVPALKADFLEVARAVRAVSPHIVIKVIVESALLTKDVDDATAENRIAAACLAVRESGCDFIKTSTGFHPAGGADVRAVALMRKHANGIKIKAAGGIRTYDDAIAMIDAGADRLGCSASIAIINQARAQQ